MVIESPQFEQVIWEEWFQNKDPESENKLFEYYMYLVTIHVQKMSMKLPSSVDKNDLTSYASLGLLDALHKFDLDRNIKFETYASYRINGSMIDELRRADWMPRAQRAKTQRVQRATIFLEQELLRSPTSEEIGEHLSITKEEVETLVTDIMISNILSIDQDLDNDDHSTQKGIGYKVPDERIDQVDQRMINVEIKNDLAKEIKKLSKNEQIVISFMYDDELTMTEIGHVMSLSTSRISQMHASAIFKLRNQLSKLKYI